MAWRPRLWISVWAVVSSILVVWDAGYCLMRPRSFRGGDLHWIWKPYSLYQDIDLVYGVEAYNAGHGFTSAQAVINLLEVAGMCIYIYKAQFAANPDPTAPLYGIIASSSTLSKTALYWLQEYYCGFCAIGHNPWNVLVPLWVVPNGLWLVFPFFILVTLWKDVATSLKITASAGQGSVATGKANGYTFKVNGKTD